MLFINDHLVIVNVILKQKQGGPQIENLNIVFLNFKTI